MGTDRYERVDRYHDRIWPYDLQYLHDQAFRGIEGSPALIHAPEDNGWVTIEELEAALGTSGALVLTVPDVLT